MKLSIGKERKKFLSSKMFGLFFEDINYAGDGGLYAEMLENRQFAFQKGVCGEEERTYVTTYAGDYGWSVCADDCEENTVITGAGMEFLEGDALCPQNPHFMRFAVQGEKAAFTNKAYDGITLKAGQSYRLKIWARANSYADDIEIAVVNEKTGIDVAKGNIRLIGGSEWHLYETDLIANKSVRGGKFMVRQKKGSVDYAYLSVMPEDAVAGVFRKDLYEMVAGTAPGFIRFPGGCIVEGANLANRYQWKKTVGESWERTWNWNRWAVHPVEEKGEQKFYSFYNQSYGIGFYEYFLLCDLLGAKPLPVLSVGIACQFQSYEIVPIETQEFQEYIQDALDLIEFANGDVTTKWGALRAKMGHPEPFGLEYICIGNEQWETEQVDFFARYKAFAEKIHAEHPEIKLIGSAGPDVTSEKYTAAWEFYRKECSNNTDFTVAVDEHYYMPPNWFYEHIHMYDEYPREIPVFAGEYAAHCDKRENNCEAALAEAAFMCGLEKNADVIRFASAAPLFAREGYTQWRPDFIWFDDEKCMGTPGYYVQQLFGAYTGDRGCEYELIGASDKIYSAVSEDDSSFYVKIINVGDETLVLDEIVGKAIKDAKILQMKANAMSDENSLQEPEKIKLREIAANETCDIPGLSCTVLVLKK